MTKLYLRMLQGDLSWESSQKLWSLCQTGSFWAVVFTWPNSWDSESRLQEFLMWGLPDKERAGLFRREVVLSPDKRFLLVQAKGSFDLDLSKSFCKNWHVASRYSTMDVLPVACNNVCIIAVHCSMASSCCGSFFCWGKNPPEGARQGGSGFDICGSCTVITLPLPGAMLLLWCPSVPFSQGEERLKGWTSLEGTREHSCFQLWPEPFLLGLVMLWVFWRIKFDSEPEWTFLAFFQFCHPACFRKSPDVGVCILSISSLTVFVFQAWQQWKET